MDNSKEERDVDRQRDGNVVPAQKSPAGASPTCKIFRDGQLEPAMHHTGDIATVLSEPDTLVWCDAVEPEQCDLATIQQQFNLHPLAIEDAIQPHERPKIVAYNHCWFLVLLATTLRDTDIVFHEIAIFVGENFLVTVRHNPPYPLEEIEERWCAHPERIRRGGGFLLYTILDTVVDNYFPVAETFQERIEVVESRLFDGDPREGRILRDIFEMKRSGQEFRHAVLPLRDMLNPIIRADLKLFPDEEIIYFRDVYDHSVRIIDQLDAIRDLTTSALEIHLAVVANRQNQITKQLTIIATIFLPLSFIVGFFGQNFGLLVANIQDVRSFWLFGIGSEILAVLLLVILFKRKGWF